MTISIKVEVVGVNRVEDSTINTYRGGGASGFLYEKDTEGNSKFVGIKKPGGKYDDVTLRVGRNEPPVICVGNTDGQIAAADFTIRIQDPEMLGQLCVGDVLMLSK
jgi:hypothetical protein